MRKAGNLNIHLRLTPRKFPNAKEINLTIFRGYNLPKNLKLPDYPSKNNSQTYSPATNRKIHTTHLAFDAVVMVQRVLAINY